jgi:hypothetical protein
MDPRPDLPAAGFAAFVSGHSLVDRPYPDFIASLLASLGQRYEWNRQYMVGSSIHQRIHGDYPPANGFAGYRQGDNREGSGMDVVAELRAPRTVSAGRYDLLLITEQNGCLAGVFWNETIACLRDYHDRFIAGNPQGVTYFHESWLSVSDLADPRRWIRYERGAAQVWRAIVAHVNLSLAQEGRPDRVLSLPMASALAALVGEATGAAGVAGVTRHSVPQTMRALFTDDVHLTELGAYFCALVTVSAWLRRELPECWRPQAVADEAAQSLRRFANRFVAQFYDTWREPDLDELEPQIRRSFNAEYWPYVRDVHYRQQMGPMAAHLKAARHQLEWSWRLRRGLRSSRAAQPA